MQQKIIQIGNSIGVIIPQALAKNNLNPGDTVMIERDEASGAVIISKDTQARLSSITPHFLSVVERINKQYTAALKEIAQK